MYRGYRPLTVPSTVCSKLLTTLVVSPTLKCVEPRNSAGLSASVHCYCFAKRWWPVTWYGNWLKKRITTDNNHPVSPAWPNHTETKTLFEGFFSQVWSKIYSTTFTHKEGKDHGATGPDSGTHCLAWAPLLAWSVGSGKGLDSACFGEMARLQLANCNWTSPYRCCAKDSSKLRA